MRVQGFGAGERGEPTLDQQLIPESAVLFIENDGLASRRDASSGSGGLNLHERDETVNLGLLGSESRKNTA